MAKLAYSHKCTVYDYDLSVGEIKLFMLIKCIIQYSIVNSITDVFLIKNIIFYASFRHLFFFFYSAWVVVFVSSSALKAQVIFMHDHFLSGARPPVCQSVRPSLCFVFVFFSSTTRPILTKLCTKLHQLRKIQVL